MKDKNETANMSNSSPEQETIEKQYIPERRTNSDNNMRIVVEDLNEKEGREKMSGGQNPKSNDEERDNYQEKQKQNYETHLKENYKKNKNNKKHKNSYENSNFNLHYIDNPTYYEENQNSEAIDFEKANIKSNYPLDDKKHSFFWNIINERDKKSNRIHSRELDMKFSKNSKSLGNENKSKFSTRNKKLPDISEDTARAQNIRNNMIGETTHEMIVDMRTNTKNGNKNSVEKLGVEKVLPEAVPNLKAAQPNLKNSKDNQHLGSSDAIFDDLLLTKDNTLTTQDNRLPLHIPLSTQDDHSLPHLNPSTGYHTSITPSYPVVIKLNPSISEDNPSPAQVPPRSYPQSPPRRLNIIGRNFRSLSVYEGRGLRFQAIRGPAYGQGGEERRNYPFFTYHNDSASFDDPDTRRQFVIKVVFIVALQLSTSFGFIMLCLVK